MLRLVKDQPVLGSLESSLIERHQCQVSLRRCLPSDVGPALGTDRAMGIPQDRLQQSRSFVAAKPPGVEGLGQASELLAQSGGVRADCLPLGRGVTPRQIMEPVKSPEAPVAIRAVSQ